MIDPIAIAIFLLALAVVVGVYLFAMKTTELTTAVTNLTTATNGLSDSVDRAVTALGNQGQPSTPDADIVPLIAAIDVQTQAVLNAKAKLDTALPTA